MKPSVYYWFAEMIRRNGLVMADIESDGRNNTLFAEHSLPVTAMTETKPLDPICSNALINAGPLIENLN